MRIIFIFTMLFPLLTLAQGGKTANGCSYRVINGQYITSCAEPEKAEPKKEVVKSDAVKTVAARPSSYGAVPVRSNPDATYPSVRTVPTASDSEATIAVPVSTPDQNQLVRDDKRQEKALEAEEIERAPRKITYFGAELGATNVTSSSAGAATSVGARLGADLDDFFGAELGYTFAKQGLNLGLDSRGTGANIAANAGRDDVTLRSHLISMDALGYFTDTHTTLRPYLGLGLAWKSSTLEEKTRYEGYQGYQPYPTNSPTSSLHQNSIGGIGSAGARVQLSRSVRLGFVFRYFFPLAQQKSQLDEGYSPYAYAPSSTRLTRSDDALTSSAQYQILGGLQYTF